MCRGLLILLTMSFPFLRAFHRLYRASRLEIVASSKPAIRMNSATTSTTDSSTQPSSSSSRMDEPVSNPLLNFYSASEEEVLAIFKSIGQPAFRFKQVKQWVYEKGVVDFNEMNNLPIDMRKKLRQIFNFGSLKLVKEQVLYIVHLWIAAFYIKQ